ncbi:hypothetical protein R6Q57_019146 [Mikania cordata]
MPVFGFAYLIFEIGDVFCTIWAEHYEAWNYGRSLRGRKRVTFRGAKSRKTVKAEFGPDLLERRVLTITPPLEVNEGVSLVQQKNKILGSRPPGCVNKCMKCSPCRATLVIPPHHKMVDCRDQSSHGEDGCYYLLSWKCKCGDKLFQP